jgi:predicted methyltransferase
MNLNISKTFCAGAIALMTVACASTPTPPSLPVTLEGAVNSSYRSVENRARDAYRRPTETLAFFEVGPEMTVVEILPSGGWYTEILAPYLATKGQYILADRPTDPRGYTKKRVEWMDRNPHIASKVMYTQFSPPDLVEVAPAGSADRVLTFRNVHNWKDDSGKLAAFKGFYKALKPGGILGVVEHRASPRGKLDPKSGYLRESDVIRLAKQAGFKLAAKSEINANPKDTRNHPEGVWTLPPSLRLGDKDREKYLAIGESDRMTLKFVKPAK